VSIASTQSRGTEHRSARRANDFCEEHEVTPFSVRRQVASLLAALALALAAASWRPPYSLSTCPRGFAASRRRTARRASPGGYVLYFRHTSTDFGQNDDR
jgi:hypothetical protein